MGDSFFGWYFKCQAQNQTLAVIPAIHCAGGRTSCSVQLITGQSAHSFSYPQSAWKRQDGTVTIGPNRFGPKGIRLELRDGSYAVSGELRFTSLTPLRYDIMGPFRHVPSMECRHSVYSMHHRVDGSVCVGGVQYEFSHADGYWEGDQGRSFPKNYAWTQYCLDGNALMLAVAEIPIAGFRFTGVTGVVCWYGRQYRLATYLGARAEHIGSGGILVRQGNSRLWARCLEAGGQRLAAPVRGSMDRVIREHLACRAAYRFELGGGVLFDFETKKASFEYEYPNWTRI